MIGITFETSRACSTNWIIVEHQNDVKQVVDQLKSDINLIAQETKHLKNGERLSKLRKLNDLRQIVSSLEEIDNSLNTLLKKELDKHAVH